ncbi:MAG: CPBP family intramembrane glutamic endopeptidase [Propionibacteriaceae bacterium]
MISLLRRYPLVSFFILAYLGSWIGWSPWWLSQSGTGLLSFELPFSAAAGINQLGLFAGPFAAAFIVVRATEGREGFRQFQRRVFQLRGRPFWWMLAFIFIPVVAGLGYLLVPGFEFALEDGGLTTFVVLAGTYFIYILGGPFQEEPGWRGFALPQLQQRLHPLIAALVLGVIHCFWHAPLFFTSEWDTARQDPSQFLAYLVLVVSMSVVLSWLANGSRGSILLVVLGHNGVNWALFAAGTFEGAPVSSNWPAALGLACLAIIAIAVTKGRLRHWPDQLSAERRSTLNASSKL